jgi:hypothetical protein
MIAARVLGDAVVNANPLEAINAAREWPYDPLVTEELDRLSSETKPKSDYVVKALSSFETCMQLGETKSAVEFLKLAAQLEGHLAKVDNKGKSGTDKLQELADMIINPADKGWDG